MISVAAGNTGPTGPTGRTGFTGPTGLTGEAPPPTRGGLILNKAVSTLRNQSCRVIAAALNPSAAKRARHAAHSDRLMDD